MPNKEDYEALKELASEMKLADACRFVRTETGYSLIEAKLFCENRAAVAYPDSVLAKDIEERNHNVESDYRFPSRC
jgi:choline kinase